ncbi:MAG: helix-turn-helix transcriptional regulator [Lachnospiraceae bacterium]|nr:helix-turn-helix transcriptional regulator [Lachnospiraceae bacterium]
MILADKLIELRKKNGWSQEEVAEKLDVSRQTISKWEGAQSIPDMNRILKLSEIFGVSTDYLLKDELELPELIQTETADPDNPARRVSMEEATAFLHFRNLSSARVSLGVMLCILSPVLLILLSGAQELGLISLSPNAAEGIGTTVLLILVVIAVALFVTTGLMGSRYEYLEQEPLDTEYGVAGMVRERREAYRNTYNTQLTIGIVLCVAAAIPILSVSIFTTSAAAELIATAVLLVTVSIGVLMIVRCSILWGSMQILLEEGDYTREEKRLARKNGPIAGIYWAVVTAAFLAYSFITRRWDQSWIIWPVAGVFFGAVAGVMRLLRTRA